MLRETSKRRQPQGPEYRSGAQGRSSSLKTRDESRAERKVGIHLPPAGESIANPTSSPRHSPRGAGLPKDWLSNSAAPRLRRDRLLADEGKVQKIDSRNALVEAALVLPELHLFLDIGDV